MWNTAVRFRGKRLKPDGCSWNADKDSSGNHIAKSWQCTRVTALSIHQSGGTYENQHSSCYRSRSRRRVVYYRPDRAPGKNVDLPPDARFSTLQDLDAKRPTEVDMFCGTMVRLGRELGVPTPFNEFALHAVKALEEKNRGIFE